MVTAKAALQVEPIPGRGSALVRWSGMGLVAASWFSAAAFAMYILAFYLGAIPAGHLEQWNNNLAGLYDKGRLTAFLAMSAHLATGAIILLLGPVQLIGSLRRRWPAVHRWIGRIYVFTAAVAGVGGLAFVISKGTIGGGPMNAGFGLYGALVLLAAVETWLQAVRGHYEVHRAWAIRLFALAIGSWLYRMDYGFWLLAVHRLGHTEDFRGPFDVFMSFFFYLPNLAIAELFIRAPRISSHRVFRMAAALALNVATIVVAVGTYYFLRFYWGPGILDALRGRAG